MWSFVDLSGFLKIMRPVSRVSGMDIHVYVYVSI